MRNLLIFSLISFLFFPIAVTGEVRAEQISITVQNASMLRQMIQVRDDVCASALPQDCELAELVLSGDECKSNPHSEACQKAAKLLKGGGCVKGLVFSGMIDPGASVRVSVCKSSAGHGSVAVREGVNGTWFRHSFLKPGSIVKVR